LCDPHGRNLLHDLSLRPRALADPPALNHLSVPRVVACAERQVLEPIRARLDIPHRVLVEPNRVPLLQLDDLAVDLDPRRPTDDLAAWRGSEPQSGAVGPLTPQWSLAGTPPTVR